MPNVIIFHIDRIHDNYEYEGRLFEKIDDEFEFSIKKINFNEKKYKYLCLENDRDFCLRENSNKMLYFFEESHP